MNVRPNPDWVTVALLGKTRGNRGELTAVSLSSKPERFENLAEVYLFGAGERYEVESTWFHDATLIFKFRGVDTISDAETLIGSEVRVPVSRARARSTRASISSPTSIGCEVVDRRTGESLGPVTGWQDGGGAGPAGSGRRSADSVRPLHLRRDRSRPRSRIAVELPEGLEGPEPPVIFHVLTIFPEFFEGPFAHGVVKRGKGRRHPRHPHPQPPRLDRTTATRPSTTGRSAAAKAWC